MIIKGARTIKVTDRTGSSMDIQLAERWKK
jgi:hypothetical protein